MSSDRLSPLWHSLNESWLAGQGWWNRDRQEQANLSKIGISEVDSSDRRELKRKRQAYEAGPAPKDKSIRLTEFSKRPLRPGEAISSGYDEPVQTRLLKKHRGHPNFQARENFNQRFRVKHLLYVPDTPSHATPKAKKKKLLADPPIAAHTPALKRQAIVPGTKNAVTTEHGKRDKSRETAIIRSLTDPGYQRYDETLAARLATIQKLTAPAEKLSQVTAQVKAWGEPLYSAHQHLGDLRHSSHFHDLTQIQQEARERYKWTTAAALSSTGNADLVPPQTLRYLHAKRNNPQAAQEQFRSDIHSGWTQVSNRATTSQAADLEHVSLAHLRSQASQRKPFVRPLSPPRTLPRSRPTGS